jgi:hypothetical protein
MQVAMPSIPDAPSRVAPGHYGVPPPAVGYGRAPARAYARSGWRKPAAIAAATGALCLLVGFVIGRASAGGGADPSTAAAPEQAPVAEVAQVAASSNLVPDPAPEPAPGPDLASNLASEPDSGTATDPPPSQGSLTGCAIDITSKPKGAAVLLAGQTLGKTPLQAEVPCGKHELEIKRRRYADQTREVDLSPGPAESLQVALERPEHTLQIVSEPPGGQVSVNRKAIGKAPVAVPVRGFEGSDVEVSLTGHKTWSRRVYARRPTTVVPARLEPERPEKPDKKPAKRRRSSGGGRTGSR